MTPPRLLLLTDRTQTGSRDLMDVLGRAVSGGARAVVLREKDQTLADRRHLAAAARALFEPVGGLLLAASSCELGADGVHLSATDLFPAVPPPIVGRSCHGADELARAAAEGCAYATLSPIFASVSKPGYGPALGPDALIDAPLPVFALGGVSAANAAACVDAGAHGVAVIGAVMRAADPAATVAAILDAVSSVARR